MDEIRHPFSLVADSGGSTTEWGLVEDPQARLETPGLNPNLCDSAQISAVLKDLVVPWLEGRSLGRIRFFCAGLAKQDACRHMRHLLTKQLHATCPIEVATDLTAAAYACLGRQPGVVGILGTGSVALASDGDAVVARRGGLGYLLGDEGGAVSLGKMLLRSLLQADLPQAIEQDFTMWSGLDLDQCTARIYNQPGAASFLARQAPFVSRHIDVPEMRALFLQEINCYLDACLVPLARSYPGPVVLMGGVARAQQTLLVEHCKQRGLSGVSVLLEKPIERILELFRSG